MRVRCTPPAVDSKLIKQIRRRAPAPKDLAVEQQTPTEPTRSMRGEGEYGILPCMTKKLKELLERAEHWPQQAQEEAIEALREIEEDFFIGPHTRKELERSHDEALRDEGASLEKIKERLGI
jgi:hypothetical protein